MEVVTTPAVAPNQNIKPYHVFQHNGVWCLIDVEEMRARKIDPATAKALETFEGKSAKSVSTDFYRQLEGLELINCSSGDQSKDNLDFWVKKEPISVATISLFLTQTCNFKCTYCYGEEGEFGTKSHMDQETAFRSIDWLIEQSREFKKINIGFFGGEPLLKFDLMKKVIEYAREKTAEADKQVGFFVNTNGSLLNDERIRYFKRNNITVKVSIDGPKEVHDAQRQFKDGSGTFELLVPKIRKLLDAIPETDGHATLLPNVDPSIVRKSLMDIGFSQISILPASVSLLSRDPAAKKGDRDSNALYRQMEEESETVLCGIKNRDGDFLKKHLLAGQFFHPLRFVLYHMKTYYPCGAGLGYVAISTSGDVYLCQRFVGSEQYKIGSIYEAKLVRQQCLDSPVISNEICANCYAKYYCAGGCAYDNISHSGSSSVPAEDMCRWWRRKFELAAYIASNLDEDDLEYLTEHKIILPKPCPLDF